MIFGQLKRILIGDPLSNENEGTPHEKIPKWRGLAVLSSDALSSVAYATEEILIPLALFSLAAVSWSIPIALVVGLLLFILTLSYRQTIQAYPEGGGAFIVAKENLGIIPGLMAAAALLIDYTLTVAVSVSAGVENIVSAFPGLSGFKVIMAIGLIVTIMIFNLRGVRESSNLLAIPTYFFIFSLLILILTGVIKLMTGGVPLPLPLEKAMKGNFSYPVVPVFLLLRAFSSGCAALMGVEGISNGVPLFKSPSKENAKSTLSWMSGILAFLFLGITFLAYAYGIVPKEGRTAISLLARSVFGSNFFFYFVQISTAMILIFAANTSYLNFPKLTSLLAKNKFLPQQLSTLGDRLVFSNGIVGLGLAAIILVAIFECNTHHLIPLYAIGVFLSFTLSQAGMVKYHYKNKREGWQKSLLLSLVGGMVTFVVLAIVAFSKFKTGAWMVLLIIPACVYVFKKIHDHYVWITKMLFAGGSYPSEKVDEPITYTAVVPISGIHPGVVDALKYACSISDDVRVCYVDMDRKATENIKRDWQRWAPQIQLDILESPFRTVVGPILKYIDQVHKQSRNEMISVVIPEFVPPKWYHHFLHNQTTLVLKAFLLLKEGKVVTTVRYHLDKKRPKGWHQMEG